MGRTYRIRRKQRTNPDKSCATREFVGSLSGMPENVALVQSIKSKGWTNANRLEPGSFRSTGRGMFAKRSIGTTDPLIELPFDSLITLATLENDNEFKSIFKFTTKEIEKKIPTQSLLALYILYRKHHYSSDPYITSIPTDFSHPFFCAKQELMALPDNIFERIHEQSQQITTSLTLLSSVIGTQSCSCCSIQYIPDIFSPSAFKWAFFAVNSRSVFIDPTNVKRVCQSADLSLILRDSPNTALATFLDLINHSDRVSPSEPEFFVPRGFKTTTELTYKLHTNQSFRPYEQIFISYGPLDNTKLLLEYGFILKNNAHDCVRFEMSDVAAFLESTAKTRKPINSNKFKFIKENQLDVEMFISRTDGGFSHNLLVVLTILFVDVAHFNNVLSIVGFGDVQPLQPVADVARQLLAFKRSGLEAVRTTLQHTGTAANGQSSSGSVVVAYLEECVTLIDDVVREFLNE